MHTSIAPILRLVLRRAVEALVLFYVALDAIFTPMFLPLVRWTAQLQLIRRLQSFVATLPPYGALVCLAVPFAIAEPAKVYALALIATGNWPAGVIVMALAYLVSLLVGERIYAAGREKLRTIFWFARLMDWLVGLRDEFLAFARSTRAYAFAIEAKRRAVETARRLRAQIGLG